MNLKVEEEEEEGEEEEERKQREEREQGGRGREVQQLEGTHQHEAPNLTGNSHRSPPKTTITAPPDTTYYDRYYSEIKV